MGFKIKNDKKLDEVKDDFTPPMADEEEKLPYSEEDFEKVLDETDTVEKVEGVDDLVKDPSEVEWRTDTISQDDIDKKLEEDGEMSAFQKALNDYYEKHKDERMY